MSRYFLLIATFVLALNVTHADQQQADQKLFALLSFNIDNRNGDSALDVIQCVTTECAEEDQNLLGTVSDGELGMGWRVTTAHPTQQSVKALLLVDRESKRLCTLNLDNHGPFMLVEPYFEGQTKQCKKVDIAQ